MIDTLYHITTTKEISLRSISNLNCGKSLYCISNLYNIFNLEDYTFASIYGRIIRGLSLYKNFTKNKYKTIYEISNNAKIHLYDYLPFYNMKG